MSSLRGVLCAFLAGASMAATAGQFGTTVAMQSRDSVTYYVAVQISGLGAADLMVDTGSGYMTINEEMLAQLQRAGQVRYLRQLRGRLANGRTLEVPVYNIASLSIGDGCWLENVEAAVFPGKTRAILGLNALQRAAPFVFSFDPPQLVLSNCKGSSTVAAVAETDLAALDEHVPGPTAETPRP
ncbi:retropepsin-like aspartic protease family protein [Denitromonas iodatirespirans]|uniref:Clan AA aspartic protease n=1 Tax=Denitromonas iodatirespirans TaxID=2795389 RepID=A0A944DQM1_DENI1|nr:retropepsin-like aspartic protease [Denitromonas iodatirespirans]MBT0962824.1 clan AA aspartic protease [Denitromonas iodatirespirans]